MKKKRRRSGLSFGTVFMLLFTVAVTLGCVGFLYRIAGAGAALRATDILSSFTFAQETEEPVLRARTAPEATSVYTAPPARQTTAAPAATHTPIPQKTTITIAAAGTVYAPKAVRQTVETGADQYDFTPVFAPLEKALGSADLAIATLETTTAGSEKGYGNYNTPVQILDALRDCGLDILALATERALDKGYDGLAITMQEMTSRGISFAGAAGDGEAAAATSSIGGVQVAVLAYTYGLSGEGEEKTQSDAQGMVAKLDSERIRSDIAAVRHAGANLVIVLPHWGTKNKAATPDEVVALAREMAVAGADIVLGTHPNVVQGIERITATRADGLAYETLVCYSLGSLLTDARTEENTAGMAVSIDVTYDPVTRRVEIAAPQVMPLYIARTREEEKTVYRVVPAEDEQAVAALEEKEQAAAQKAAGIVRNAAGEEGLQ
ncbi:MAG: CapA family protein [Clostridia bacterium]|nr:CapA family protein [Clostridia bacterium]